MLGKRIAQLRKRAGLSQAVAAKRAGIPVQTLRNWETGRREPLFTAACKLADALGISVAAFADPLDEEDESTLALSQVRKVVPGADRLAVARSVLVGRSDQAQETPLEEEEIENEIRGGFPIED